MHTSGGWMRVRLAMTKDEAFAYLGEPCPDYERGCCVCRGWRSWMKSKRVTVLIDRKELIRALIQGRV